MSLQYKVNCLELLKEKGYSSYRLLKEKPIGQASIQKLRKGEMVGHVTLEKICELLELQPGDIIEYVPDKK